MGPSNLTFHLLFLIQTLERSVSHKTYLYFSQDFIYALCISLSFSLSIPHFLCGLIPEVVIVYSEGGGRKKGTLGGIFQQRSRLGISGKIKIKELTKSQIGQIEEMIGQDHVVHWELKREERADTERLIYISRYRGIRHQEGSPLRGQRTHTSARTSRKQNRK
ncbi:hypothetical protein MKX01_033568 [Papaver californicum]|nr:hypothetical protein MKX01_033568 [Papaver californicum]